MLLLNEKQKTEIKNKIKDLNKEKARCNDLINDVLRALMDEFQTTDYLEIMHKNREIKETKLLNLREKYYIIHEEYTKKHPKVYYNPEIAEKYLYEYIGICKKYDGSSSRAAYKHISILENENKISDINKELEIYEKQIIDNH